MEALRAVAGVMPLAPVAARRGSSQNGGGRARAPYFDRVQELLREDLHTPPEIAELVGHGCTAQYVRNISHRKFSQPGGPRTEDDIKADLARMLEDVEARYHAGITAARCEDPI